MKQGALSHTSWGFIEGRVSRIPRPLTARPTDQQEQERTPPSYPVMSHTVPPAGPLRDPDLPRCVILELTLKTSALKHTEHDAASTGILRLLSIFGASLQKATSVLTEANQPMEQDGKAQRLSSPPSPRLASPTARPLCSPACSTLSRMSCSLKLSPPPLPQSHQNLPL